MVHKRKRYAITSPHRATAVSAGGLGRSRGHSPGAPVECVARTEPYQIEPAGPLAQLVVAFDEWTGALMRTGLVRRAKGPDDPDQPVLATTELEPFHQTAKDIILCLELHGRDADAARVEGALAVLRAVARAYDAGELHPVFPTYADEPLTPRDQPIDAATETSGCLEDLLDELPADVWQGFDDA